MKNSTWAMLNEAEKELLRDTEKDALAGLDEDELIELHTRVRRARNKYSKLYRRRASAQVGKDSARGGAHKKHARTAVKAEVFEDALARVSRSLSRAAKASADELKAERLAAARGERAGGAAAKGGGRGKKGGGSARTEAKAKRRTPASKRASATSRASTRRNQARRDAR